MYQKKKNTKNFKIYIINKRMNELNQSSYNVTILAPSSPADWYTFIEQLS